MNKSRIAIGKWRTVSFAAVAVISGIMLPKYDGYYILGYFVSMFFTTLALVNYFIVKKLSAPNKSTLSPMLIWMSLLSVCSVFAGLYLTSFGSYESASGDIGGFSLWILPTLTTLILSLLTATEPEHPYDH